ncbi:hypothetical protein ANTPLA_LOCUS7296 [Anthophora plagiata]
MRITNLLLYKVHNIPYRFRGKYGKVKKPTMKDIIQFKIDLEREEQNMLLLRHPYLTVDQSKGHMKEAKQTKTITLMNTWREAVNEKFNRRVTIADRLSHLGVHEAWE